MQSSQWQVSEDELLDDRLDELLRLELELLLLSSQQHSCAADMVSDMT
jgi:hypothetical protein